MCGRYVQVTPVEEVLDFFDARAEPEVIAEHRASFNIPPTTSVLAIAAGEDGRVGQHYRWGLVPFWAKELSLGNRAFNARAESVATKPMFRAAFRERRVVVPADAYYEWQVLGPKAKQAYAFQRADGAPLAFAGLWEYWRDPRDGTVVHSCAILTTQASPDIVIHDRMPVILDQKDIDAWIDPANRNLDALLSLSVPAPSGTLVRRAVSARVGAVSNDDAHLLDPLVTEDGEIIETGQLSLDV
jgi:putative SOS response-associated peptidase YedK